MAENTSSRFIFDKGIPTETDMFANATQWVLDIYHVGSGASVSFKAMLKEYKDNPTPISTDENVYGRMDPIINYSHTSRKIQLSWVVPSTSEEEAIDNFQKLNRLKQMLYPVYDENTETTVGNSNVISTAPLWKVKFANLICDANSPGSKTASSGGLLGMPGNFSADANIDIGVFTIGSNLYFKEYTISFSYSVNHQHTVGWENQKDKTGFKRRAFPHHIRTKDLDVAEENLDNQSALINPGVDPNSFWSEDVQEVVENFRNELTGGGTIDSNKKEIDRRLNSERGLGSRNIQRRKQNQLRRNVTGRRR